MYSRSTNQGFSTGGNFRVPNNYRGNAFSFDRPKYEPPHERESDVIIPKTEVKNETAKEPCEEEEEKAPEICEKEEKHEPSLFGFSSEDILLLALILILSANGAEDDILLMLALLLAYKK